MPYCLKGTLTEVGKKRPQDKYSESIGVIPKYYDFVVENNEKEFKVQLWELYPKAPCISHYPDFQKNLFKTYIQSSKMNILLINSDKGKDENYEQLCKEYLNLLKDLCKNKEPTICMWGNEYKHIDKLKIDIYRKTREAAITSAFELIASENPKIHLKLKNKFEVGTYVGNVFNSPNMQNEVKYIETYFPNIRMDGGYYHIRINPSIFTRKTKGIKEINMRISPTGGCSLSLPEKKNSIPICLFAEKNAELISRDKNLNLERDILSQGASILIAILNKKPKTLKRSAKKNLRKGFKELIKFSLY